MSRSAPVVLLLVLCACSPPDTGGAAAHHFEWSEGAPPGQPFRYGSAVATADRLYAISGEKVGAFASFDPGHNRWIALSPLPTPRAFFAVSALDGSIYAAGGLDSTGFYVGTVQRYDIDAASWQTLAKGIMPRSRLSMTSLNGKLYAIGGLAGTGDREYHNSALVEVYDPVSGAWSPRRPMPTPRHGHAAVAIGGRIYVVGGYADDSTSDAMEPVDVVEIYDPETDTWGSASPMPTPRGFFGLATIDSILFAIGGRVRDTIAPVEFYDPSNDRWSTGEEIPQRRQRFGMACIGRRVFIVGGEEHPESMLIGTLQ